MHREEILDLDVFLKEVYSDILKLAESDGIGGLQASMIPVMVAISMEFVSVVDIANEIKITRQGTGRTLREMVSSVKKPLQPVLSCI